MESNQKSSSFYGISNFTRVSNQTPGTTFFRDVKAIDERRQPDTLVFFKHVRKDFIQFSVHGNSCVEMITETIPEIQNDVTTEEGVESLKFSNRHFEKVISKLLTTSTTTSCKNIQIYVKTNQQRWVSDITASRGNVQAFQDILFRNQETFDEPSLMCVQFNKHETPTVVSVGVLRTSLNQMYVTEFVDSDQMTNLEALIVQLNVKECLYVNSDKTKFLNEKISDVCKRSMCTLNLVESYKSPNVSLHLRKLVKGGTQRIPNEMKMVKAVECLGRLIEHVNLFRDRSNHGFYSLSTYQHSKFLKLDSSVIRNLELLPFLSVKKSLFHLLNQCVTKMGSRRLNNWIRQPLLAHAEILMRQEIVLCFHSDVVLLETVQKSLKYSPDLDRLLKNLQSDKTKLLGLVKLYQFICTFEDIHKALREYSGESKDMLARKYLGDIRELSAKFQKYSQFIEEVIDLKKVLEDREYLINPKFDERLQRIHERMEKYRAKINKHYRKFRIEHGIEKKYCKLTKIKGQEELGLCLAVTGKSRKKLLKEEDVKELKTLKATLFVTTSSLQKYAQQHQLLYEDYLKKQKSVKREVVAVAKTYIPVIEKLAGIISEIDILSTLANVAAKYQFVRPRILEKEKDVIEITKGFHPVVKTFLTEDKSFIPNDLRMERTNGSFQIITGPNMGGKSTYLKQNAIIVLLAQIGSFVPAEKAVISIRDGLFARIGANDFQLRGVSTFMLEMLETSSILENASKHSMIIVDELGRGTSSYDGYALAWAISEKLITDLECFCLFATHFHELSNLEKNFPRVVKNYHLTVDMMDLDSGVKQLTMLYDVREGSTEKSFGIDVANMVKFPESVIVRAKRKVEQLSCNVEDLDEEEDENPAKRRKLSKDSEEFFQNTLEEFSAMPFDEMEDDEISVQFMEFKAKVNQRISQNQQQDYIDSLINTFGNNNNFI